MKRVPWVLPLVVLGLIGPKARAEEPPAGVLALEKAVQAAVARAEPAVACVLVSRSREYRAFEVLAEPSPGRLGGFNLRQALATVSDRDEKRVKQIKSLDLSDPDVVPESYGSGIVLDARAGLVLTCAHVVRGAVKVYVRLPGGKGSWADIHASDPRSDLAVLRLLDPPDGMKVMPLGDGGSLQKGNFIISISNPYAAGFRDGSPSVSWGVVANLRRRRPGFSSEIDRNRLSLHHFGTLIQTDVRINAGCSGGALINLKGEMVGLITATAALTGVDTPGGFAMPLDRGFKGIIEVLKRGEEVEYGFLGVQFDTNVRDGVRLADVIMGSPASRAGLRMGDYLLSVNGKPVRDAEDVFLALGTVLAGSSIEVERSRNPRGPGETLRLTPARYWIPTSGIASKQPPAPGGLRVEWTSIAYQKDRWGRRGISSGVTIREVVKGSPAEKARLQTGQTILKVDGDRVDSPSEFYTVMARKRDQVELTVTALDGKLERVTLKLNGQ